MEAAAPVQNLDDAAGPVSPFSEAALYICFAILCLRGGREGDIRLLLRAARVSRTWRNAVHGSLPLVPRIVFPAHVTGADVLEMLMRVAGANLKAVSLEGCRRLSAVDVGRILADLAARCPAVIEVNLTDCGEEAILRVLATAAKRQFGAVSPADLHAMPWRGEHSTPSARPAAAQINLVDHGAKIGALWRPLDVFMPGPSAPPRAPRADRRIHCPADVQPSQPHEFRIQLPQAS